MELRKCVFTHNSLAAAVRCAGLAQHLDEVGISLSHSPRKTCRSAGFTRRIRLCGSWDRILETDFVQTYFLPCFYKCACSIYLSVYLSIHPSLWMYICLHLWHGGGK
jgi:hypothetical protein